MRLAIFGNGARAFRSNFGTLPGGPTRNMAAITDGQHQTMTMHGPGPSWNARGPELRPKPLQGSENHYAGGWEGLHAGNLPARCKKHITTTTANPAKRQIKTHMTPGTRRIPVILPTLSLL